MKDVNDIDWRKVVNNINGPFPEIGSDIPELEIIRKDKIGLQDKGEFSKLSMVVYFFSDKETGKTYSTQRHWLVEFGEVPLKQAIEAIKRNV